MPWVSAVIKQMIGEKFTRLVAIKKACLLFHFSWFCLTLFELGLKIYVKWLGVQQNCLLNTKSHCEKTKKKVGGDWELTV